MLATFLGAYDIGSPSFLGFGIVREVNPATGVSIVLAIPFAFAVAFALSLALAFPFPVSPFAARDPFAPLAALAANFSEGCESVLVGFL